VSYGPLHLPPALDGVNVKFERANEHILELQEATAPVLDRASYRVVPTPIGPRIVAYRVEDLKPVDARWSAIVGDALTNLRATLDHLARQLFVLDGGQGRAEVYFPIMKRPRADGGPPRLGDHQVADSLISHHLDERQPYRDTEPAGHPLAVLNDLVNRDKHESLILTQGVLAGSSWGLETGAASPQVSVHRGPVVSGTEVAIFTFAEDVPPEFRPTFDLELYFADPTVLGPRSALNWLTVIQGYVGSTVNRFVPFF